MTPARSSNLSPLRQGSLLLQISAKSSHVNGVNTTWPCATGATDMPNSTRPSATISLTDSFDICTNKIAIHGWDCSTRPVLRSNRRATAQNNDSNAAEAVDSRSLLPWMRMAKRCVVYHANHRLAELGTIPHLIHHLNFAPTPPSRPPPASASNPAEFDLHTQPA